MHSVNFKNTVKTNEIQHRKQAIFALWILSLIIISLSVIPGFILYRKGTFNENNHESQNTQGELSQALSANSTGQIIIDGDPFDWNSSDLIAADTAGETSATSLDILSLCYREVNDSLYFRVDFRNQWIPLDAGWRSPLFTYLSELNFRLLISFEGTNSTYKSAPGMGTEFVNVWHPWLTSIEPKVPTSQGWDYAVILDFKRSQFKVMTPQTLANPQPMAPTDYAANAEFGMVEFRVRTTFAQRGKMFHAVVYTINESTNPWSPADICPNGLGNNINDYFQDGDIDAYAVSTVRIQPAKFAIVWHANQALGKNQIEGKSIVDTYIDNQRTGFSRVLGAHMDYKAPVNLHWSGTLLTGMQWFTPDFLPVIRESIDSGIVEIMTSTFGQSIMTWLPEDFNIYSIQKESDLIERLFGVRPTTGWVPERCWNQFIFDDLLQADIKAVVLDPQEIGHFLGYSPPEDVMYATPTQAYLSLNGTGRLHGGANDPNGIPSTVQPGDLKIFIINNDVQGMFWDTCVSNNFQRYVDMKSKMAYYASLSNPNHIIVVASDMEIPGGHPYGFSWDGNIGNRYEHIIKGLAAAPYISLEKLSDNLNLDVYDTINPGFKNSGEPDHFSSYGQPKDEWYYARFTQESPNRTSAVFRDSSTSVATPLYPEVPAPIHSKADVRNYSMIFYDSYNAIKQIEAITPINKHSTRKLLELANLTLLCLTYETAWCDFYNDPVWGNGEWLASWGKTLWAKMHYAEMIARVANWTLNPPSNVIAQSWDIDGDAYDELVIKTPQIFCVMEKEGARISFLANINGSVIIGNPMANPQVTKPFGEGGAQSAVEDYFNPITLNPEDIVEYFDNNDVPSGLINFFAYNAKGGYPVNNGTGGFYYAVPFNITINTQGDSLRLELVSQDLPDTSDNEFQQIKKIFTFEKDQNYIRVRHQYKDASSSDVYLGFSPDLLSLFHHGKKYLHTIAFDNKDIRMRTYFNGFSGTLAGVSWSSDQQIIDKTPTDSIPKSLNIDLSAWNISNQDIQKLYLDYGKQKILSMEIVLNVKNNTEFILYAGPNMNIENSISSALNTPASVDSSKILSTIDQLANKFYNNASLRTHPKWSTIQSILTYATSMKTRIKENQFFTYRYGEQAIAALKSGDWILLPPTHIESFLEDVDGDGKLEYIIQNNKIRFAVKQSGGIISFMITDDGLILTKPKDIDYTFSKLLELDLEDLNTFKTINSPALIKNQIETTLFSMIRLLQQGVNQHGFLFDFATNGSQNLLKENPYELQYNFPNFAIRADNLQLRYSTFTFFSGGISKSYTLYANQSKIAIKYGLPQNIKLSTLNSFNVNPASIPEINAGIQRQNGTIETNKGEKRSLIAYFSNASQQTLIFSWISNESSINYINSSARPSNSNEQLLQFDLLDGGEFEISIFNGTISDFLNTLQPEQNTTAIIQILTALTIISILSALLLTMELLYKLNKLPSKIRTIWSRMTRRRRPEALVSIQSKRTYEDLLDIMLQRNFPREKALALIQKYKNQSDQKKIEVLKILKIPENEYASFLALHEIQYHD